MLGHWSMVEYVIFINDSVYIKTTLSSTNLYFANIDFVMK